MTEPVSGDAAADTGRGRVLVRSAGRRREGRLCGARRLPGHCWHQVDPQQVDQHLRPVGPYPLQPQTGAQGPAVAKQSLSLTDTTNCGIKFRDFASLIFCRLYGLLWKQVCLSVWETGGDWPTQIAVQLILFGPLCNNTGQTAHHVLQGSAVSCVVSSSDDSGLYLAVTLSVLPGHPLMSALRAPAASRPAARLASTR